MKFFVGCLAAVIGAVILWVVIVSLGFWLLDG